MSEPLFAAAYPFADDVLALPVEDLDRAAEFYARTLGLVEIGRKADPPTVVMERDGVRIGLAVNGGDPTQDGAAILVTDLDRARREIEASGTSVGESRTDVRDGKRFAVFFVVAPDGLCFYLHQRLDDT